MLGTVQLAVENGLQPFIRHLKYKYIALFFNWHFAKY